MPADGSPSRAFLNLPYYAAVMHVERPDSSVHYQSSRRIGGAEFDAIYEPAGAPLRRQWARLKYFLTERYCLYHEDRGGRPYRFEIHHRPWSLQVARATIATNTMAAGSHLTLIGGPALLHFAGRQDVIAWAPNWLTDRHHRSVRNVTEYRNSVTGGM